MVTETKTAADAGTEAPARRNKRTMTGIVTSNKMQKTITVEVTRLVKHPMYGKYVRRRSSLKAHDERSEAKTGDTVIVIECRPMSRTKRWRLQKVLSKAIER